MADVKISALPVATVPLAGTELVPIVQSGVTEQVTVANLTAGRSVAASELVVSANSATDAVRITQTGAGNALVVEDSANPDATPFVVEANGRLIVGSTATQPSLGASNTPQIGVFGNSASNNGFANYSYTASTSGNFFNFAKSRSVTPGSFSILSDGDDLGYIKFNGDDGTQFLEAARIWAEVDGTPGLNDMPGRLVFSTTADGASSPTERMRIDSEGRVGIGTSSLAATQQMRVQFALSDAAANAINLQTSGTHTLTNNNAFAYTAVDAGATVNQAAFNATAALTTGGGARGQRAFVQTSGASGTVTAASGFVADVRNTGAGTLTTGAGFVAALVQNSGGGTLTNAMGFYAGPQTGGTNNYGFYSDVAAGANRWNFYANGTAANYFAGDMQLDKTVTASGTTGAQTINKNAGTVNFAAAATSLVVTNSRVTANSIIIATVATVDTTMKSVVAVASAGSFTLTANAAATAETRVNWLIIN